MVRSEILPPARVPSGQTSAAPGPSAVARVNSLLKLNGLAVPTSVQPTEVTSGWALRVLRPAVEPSAQVLPHVEFVTIEANAGADVVRVSRSDRTGDGLGGAAREGPSYTPQEVIDRGARAKALPPKFRCPTGNFPEFEGHESAHLPLRTTSILVVVRAPSGGRRAGGGHAA